jgi:hypothetical protein
MIFLSWNCRGLAKSSTVRCLRALIRKHKPDVLFLTETKNAPHLASPILRQLGFLLIVQAPPCNTKGGLLLAWKIDVKLTSFYVSNNIICAWYYSDVPNVKYLISFVYGPPYSKNNSDFWTTLASFGATYPDHWLCVGDFNAITSPDDKLGGRPFNNSTANPFSDFINSFGMVDLGFSGNPYTWSNHRQGSSIIKERLDRCIATSQWLHWFPSFSVTLLPAHTFDHNPLLLNSSLPLPSLPRPFRFEEFWTRDPSCEIVVGEAWSSPITGSPSYCLTQKLKYTKKAIRHWNKHYFGDIRTKLNPTLQLLDATQRAPPSDSNLALELHLQSQLDEYLLQEESLWKSKSRELWLTCVDLNTKFFHTSTLIRRNRNTISLLQSPNSGWLSDRQDIGDCFVNNFKDLYASTCPSPHKDHLALFDSAISVEDNVMLCATPTEFEIFDSLNSLGLSKAPGPDGFTALFYVKYWVHIRVTVLQAVGHFLSTVNYFMSRITRSLL